MSSKPDEAKAGLIEKTVEHAHAKLPPEQAERLEAFIRIYYGAVAADDLLERSVADLYGAALAHLNFGSRRAPGEPKVHVYTPQLEEHGWSSTHTVVEIVNDDMPFLVDSVNMELNRLGSGVHLIIHPVVRVRRDEGGRLLEVLPHDAEARDCGLESFIHAEIVRETDPAHLEQVRAGLERVLADVRAAVDDWAAIVERGREVVTDLAERPPPVEAEELAEATALLEWILDHHFTFLGYHEYDLIREGGDDALRRVPGTGLGILRDSDPDPGIVKLGPEAQALAREKEILILTKANSRATVHRPSYLDYIGVKRFDESGEVVGERRFLGLYTSTAYSAGRMKSHSCAARSARCGSAPASRLEATPTRLWSRSSRRTRATSFSRSRTTSSSRSPWASSSSASASASASSSAVIGSDASSPAWCSCRATASTRRSERRSRRSCKRSSTGSASTTTSASPSPCSRGFTT